MHVFIVAGEPSGDFIGSLLIQALKNSTSQNLTFSGIGGEKMSQQSFQSLIPLQQLSLFGIFEIIPRIPRLLKHLKTITRYVLTVNPDIVITIDSPGFNFRLVKRLRKKRRPFQNFPCVHIVAPSVWAWNPKRVYKVASLYDHLLVLLPFEPQYFTPVGLKTTWIGHPVLESGAHTGDAQKFRQRYHIPQHHPLITFLPGSRYSETSRLLPIFQHVLSILIHHHPFLVPVIPIISQTRDHVSQSIAKWNPQPILVHEEKYDAFAASSVAVAASGTVALELAVAGLPSVIVYKIHPLTALLARYVLRIRYVSLVNILLEDMAIPELLQHNCTPASIAKQLLHLLHNHNARQTQRQAYQQALSLLQYQTQLPSIRSAQTILELLHLHNNNT